MRRGASTSIVASSGMAHAVRRVRLAAHALRPTRCIRNREEAAVSRDATSVRASTVRCAQHADASPSTRAGERLERAGQTTGDGREGLALLPTGMGMAVVVGAGAATLLLEPVRRTLPPRTLPPLPEPSDSIVDREGVGCPTALPNHRLIAMARVAHTSPASAQPPPTPWPRAARCVAKTLSGTGYPGGVYGFGAPLA